MVLRAVALTLAVMVAGAAAAAQTVQTPEAAVRAYLDALQQSGFEAAPEHLHPDELARFRELVLPLFSPEGAKDYREFLSAFFGSTATPESVKDLPAIAFARAFMTLAARQMNAAGIRYEQGEVVGAVTEGDVVHVITRIKLSANGQLADSDMEVVSVKRSADRWMLMLTGRLEGLAQALRAQARPTP